MEQNPMERIELLAREHAEARDRLTTRAQVLDDEIRKVQRVHAKGLKFAIGKVAETESALLTAIQANPELFERPRSRVLHGLRLGYQKGKGSVSWADDEHVVRGIRRLLPEQFNVLVKVTEKPLKEPLSQLPAAELKRLGVTVQAADDGVFVRPVDSSVDKLVSALLKGWREELETADAA